MAFSLSQLSAEAELFQPLSQKNKIKNKLIVLGLFVGLNHLTPLTFEGFAISALGYSMLCYGERTKSH